MKKILIFTLSTLSLTSTSLFASDLLCSKGYGFNTGLSIKVVNNGKQEEEQPLKKLEHIVKRDTHEEATTLLDNVACDIEENSAICFHNETSDKFFITTDEESKKSALVLIANTKLTIDAANSVGIEKAETELGEAYVIKDLTCVQEK